MIKGIEQVVVDMGIVLFTIFLTCKSNVAGCLLLFFALSQIQTTLLDYIIKNKRK